MAPPFPYKISTITATGGVNTTINLELLYGHLRIDPVDAEITCPYSFQYVEFGKKKSETFYRGFSKKLTVSRRKKTVTKRFDNQATVIVRSSDLDGKQHHVNMKVFKNGNVQITGLKYIEQGIPVINFLIEELRYIYAHHCKDVVESYDALHNSNYRIRLINSDFRFGFDIKRDRLFKILKTDYPHVKKSYEPCIYPGVKIQYFWNDELNNVDGCCTCDAKCSGKGSGHGDGRCKKITIAVFQSGCVIITGAQSHEQIMSAYEFICGLIEKHTDDIKKQVLAASQLI